MKGMRRILGERVRQDIVCKEDAKFGLLSAVHQLHSDYQLYTKRYDTNLYFSCVATCLAPLNLIKGRVL